MPAHVERAVTATGQDGAAFFWLYHQVVLRVDMSDLTGQSMLNDICLGGCVVLPRSHGHSVKSSLIGLF